MKVRGQNCVCLDVEKVMSIVFIRVMLTEGVRPASDLEELYCTYVKIPVIDGVD